MSMTATAQAALGEPGRFAKVGEAIFVQTVSYYWLGRVSSIYDINGHAFFSLDEASWVAETQQFSLFFKNGDIRTLEPVPWAVNIAFAGVTAWMSWPHALPRVSKQG